jgi:hypothetical protein
VDEVIRILKPALIGAAIAFATSWFWYVQNLKSKAKERRDLAFSDMVRRTAELEKQIAVLGQAVQPISVAFQSMLIKELTHFHTPVMDDLMTRIGPPSTLTVEEETELAAALKERAEDPGQHIPQSEREAALMLPYVIRRAKAEVSVQNSLPEMRLVAITKVAEEVEPAEK